MILKCQHCKEEVERTQYREKVTCFKCRRKEQNEYCKLRRERNRPLPTNLEENSAVNETDLPLWEVGEISFG